MSCVQVQNGSLLTYETSGQHVLIGSFSWPERCHYVSMSPLMDVTSYITFITLHYENKSLLLGGEIRSIWKDLSLPRLDRESHEPLQQPLL